MQPTVDELVAGFRRGAQRYVRDYGERPARERTSHFWLAICVAQAVDPRHVIGELHVRKKDLTRCIPKSPARQSLVKNNTGAFGFDLCLAHWPDFDARSWQIQIKKNRNHTIAALSSMAVVAELKVADSGSTTSRSVEQDLLKLLAVARATETSWRWPRLFFVAAPGPGEARKARLKKSVAKARKKLEGWWPRDEPEMILAE